MLTGDAAGLTEPAFVNMRYEAFALRDVAGEPGGASHVDPQMSILIRAQMACSGGANHEQAFSLKLAIVFPD